VAATDRHAPFDRSGEAGGPGAGPGRTPAGLLAPRDRGAPRKFCRIGEIVEHRGHRTNEAFGISEAIDVTESDRHAPFDRSGEAGGPGAGPGRTPAGPRRPRQRGAPPKFYRIGEIVEYTGVSRQTIHNYTTMGLITESRRTRGGHRLYTQDVFARLDLIADLKGEKKSMREIRKHFDAMDGVE